MMLLVNDDGDVHPYTSNIIYICMYIGRWSLSTDKRYQRHTINYEILAIKTIESVDKLGKKLPNEPIHNDKVFQ